VFWTAALPLGLLVVPLGLRVFCLLWLLHGAMWMVVCGPFGVCVCFRWLFGW
jgi:hypothetical protein